MYVLLRLQVLPQLVDFTNCAHIPKRGKVIIFVNSIDGCYKLKLFLERFAMKVAVLNAELPVNTRCGSLGRVSAPRDGFSRKFSYSIIPLFHYSIIPLFFLFSSFHSLILFIHMFICSLIPFVA